MLTATARILLHRWVWVALALVLALTAGGAAYKLMKPKQASSAEMLFLPSTSQPGTAALSNPFLNVGQSTLTMSFVVQTSALDSAVVSKLGREGYTASYTIVPNPAPNSGPTLLVKAEGKSAATTQATLNAVLKEMQNVLHAKQADIAGLPDKLFITASVITQSPHPLPVRKSQVQTAVIAFVVVLFVGLIMILMVERRHMSRAAKRAVTRQSPNGQSVNGEHPASRPGQLAGQGHGPALGPGLAHGQSISTYKRVRRIRHTEQDPSHRQVPTREEPDRDHADDYSRGTYAISSDRSSD